jgi:hypothetical protein
MRVMSRPHRTLVILLTAVLAFSALPAVARAQEAPGLTALPPFATDNMIRAAEESLGGMAHGVMLLPDSLPVADPEDLDFELDAGPSWGYSFELYVARGCRSAGCYLGTVEAVFGGTLSPGDPAGGDTVRDVVLARNTPGRVIESCDDLGCTASVEWIRDDIRYRVSFRNESVDVAVRVADSAIRVGIR